MIQKLSYFGEAPMKADSFQWIGLQDKDHAPKTMDRVNRESKKYRERYS